MNASQTSLYWRLWGQACRVQGWNAKGGMKTAAVDAKRKEVMRAALGGKDVSSKDLTNDQFTAVKAAFLAAADNLAAAQEVDHPELGKARNVRWHIEQELMPCIALYRADAGAFVLEVIRDKFNCGKRTEQLSLASLSNEPRWTTRHGKPEQLPSELEQLQMTLAARLNDMRKAQKPYQSIHDMKTAAGVWCDCAQCNKRRAYEAALAKQVAPAGHHEASDNEVPAGVELTTGEGDPW